MAVTYKTGTARFTREVTSPSLLSVLNMWVSGYFLVTYLHLLLQMR